MTSGARKAGPTFRSTRAGENRRAAALPISPLRDHGTPWSAAPCRVRARRPISSPAPQACPPFPCWMLSWSAIAACAAGGRPRRRWREAFPINRRMRNRMRPSARAHAPLLSRWLTRTSGGACWWCRMAVGSAPRLRRCWASRTHAPKACWTTPVCAGCRTGQAFGKFIRSMSEVISIMRIRLV